jgi:protein phosphatase 1L
MPNQSQDDTTRSLFAVFDGHGGSKCSSFLAETFPKLLANHPKFILQPLAALQEVWSILDNEFYNLCKTQTEIPRDGSTATVCIMIDEDLYVANCGDSACFVINEHGVTRQMTEDHGSHMEAEAMRCKGAYECLLYT